MEAAWVGVSSRLAGDLECEGWLIAVLAFCQVSFAAQKG